MFSTTTLQNLISTIAAIVSKVVQIVTKAHNGSSNVFFAKVFKWFDKLILGLF